MKRPYINEMFPNLKSHYEWDYRERDEQREIFSFYQEFLGEDDNGHRCEYCDEEDCYGECEGEDPPEFKSLDGVTLQTILDRLPKGISPSDVKISLNIDVGAMSVNGSELKFYYIEHVKADPVALKKAQLEYNVAYAKYENELEKYKEWEKEQEIKVLEEKLAKLKK